MRLRFDDVIEILDKSNEKFYNQLKSIDYDRKYNLTFLPHDGDIVIFDNWRLYCFTIENLDFPQ